MEKIGFLAICGVILSAYGLLAVAAEPTEVNEPTAEEPVMHTEGIEEAEAEAAEPNSPQERLKKAWVEVDRASDSEAKRWLELEMDKRIEFARAAKKTTEAQLQLLKLIAELEGATQTITAIDKILEARAAKVDEVLDEAREARRQERIKELEERRKAREELRKSRREQMNQ